jgi:uncharacterized membrane protein
MIQRVQSIYLILCTLCLASLLFGIQFIEFQSKEFLFSISALKIETIDLKSSELISSHFHFGGILIGVLLLSTIITLLNFKNLKKQFKLGRALFFTYFMVLIGIILWISLGQSTIDSEIETRNLGFGFLLFVIAFPFIFLANIGIKRDKKLLESLDRLR